MIKKIWHGLILAAMGVNGALYLAWLLSPPNPDRIGYWFIIYFMVFPVLAILGLMSLLLKSTLNLSWELGGWVLGYVGLLTILANSYVLGLTPLLDWLPSGSYETIHFLLFGVTLVRLIMLIQR